MIYGQVQSLRLPVADELVMPGLRWGAFDELFTPAYWRGQAWLHGELGTYRHLRLGTTLPEEVAACLLGGFGMPAELALAAYERLRISGMLADSPSSADIQGALSEPFLIRGRARRYRFVRQKSDYLSSCLEQLRNFREPVDDHEFRNRLAELPGIGLKTASWIVRNVRPRSEVAVIDVHILRAGQFLGLFPSAWQPSRHYIRLEQAFVAFAQAIESTCSLLDGMMWDQMRQMGAICR